MQTNENKDTDIKHIAFFYFYFYSFTKVISNLWEFVYISEWFNLYTYFVLGELFKNALLYYT